MRQPPHALVRAAEIGTRRFPAARQFLRKFTGGLHSSDAVIGHGAAKGLRINAAGAQTGYALGTVEPELQEALQQHLSSGDVYYDIGANIGFFTIAGAGLVGPSGQVHAFEPLPANAAALRHNIDLNAFEHVQVVEAAVGTGPGTALLNASTLGVLAHLQSVDRPHAAGETVEVKVVSIDDEIAAGRAAPTVVKMDVEGAEIDALEGMRRTIEQSHPTLLVEIHGKEAEYEAFCESVGYRYEVLGNRSGTDADGAPVPFMTVAKPL